MSNLEVDDQDIFTNYYGGYEGGKSYTQSKESTVLGIRRGTVIKAFAAIQLAGFVLLLLIVVVYFFVALGVKSPGFDFAAALKSLLFLLPFSVSMLFGGDVLRNLAGGNGFKSDVFVEALSVKEDIFS